MALATAYGFADDPLITLSDDPTGATVTRVRALHIEQLRAAVDAVRVLAGLNAAAWNEAAVVGGLIRATHVQELRTRLNWQKERAACTCVDGALSQSGSPHHRTSLSLSLQG